MTSSSMDTVVAGKENLNADEKQKRNEKKKNDRLAPITDPIRRREFVIFDLESKRLDTQDPGFERPFLACVYDGSEYVSFRDDDEVLYEKPRFRTKGDAVKNIEALFGKGRRRSYTERYWHEPGGCIDKMMRYLLGLRICAECKITKYDYRWGRCEECVRARKRFQGKNNLIVAHNGGNFDNLFVLGWVRRHSSLFVGSEIINVQSRMLVFTIKPRGIEQSAKHEKWTFTDSIALLPKSLKEIGKSFCADDPDFQKMVFDLAIPEEDPNWEEYNRRDCAVLHKALNRFRELIEHLGGAIGLTAASTAMQLFRRKFLKEPIPRNSHFHNCNGRCRDPYCEHLDCMAVAVGERLTECHGCMHKFVMGAFFGGRTEIFRTHGKSVIYSDLNSSYPTAMLDFMPIGKARMLPGGESLQMLKLMAKKYIGFVEAIVEVPCELAGSEELGVKAVEKGKEKHLASYLPPLPYRWKKPGGEMKLVFPTGRLYGTWSWVELELAMSVGCKIKEIGRSVWYGKGKLFEEMIHTLYAYRQKKCKVCGLDVKEGHCKCPTKTWDPGLDEVAKLMMNSTFGKFATNVLREKVEFKDLDYDHVERSIEHPPWMKDAPKRVQHILVADYVVPQIAAHITALARRRLYLGFKSVLDRYHCLGVKKDGKRCDFVFDTKGKNVRPIRCFKCGARMKRGEILYGDTDSAVTTLPVFPQGGQLGEWKVEEENFNFEVLLPKTYMMSALHKKGCTGFRHKKSCTNEDCIGCIKPGYVPLTEMDEPKCTGCVIKVKMKGVPQGVQRPDVFDHLRRGKGTVMIDEKTKQLVKVDSLKDRDGKLVELDDESKGAIAFRRLTKHRTMLRDNLDSPIEDETQRSMQSTYDKRTFYGDDGDTIPLVIIDPPTLAEARARHGRGYW